MASGSGWAALLGLVCACDGGGAHLYSAQQFDPARGCVEAPVIIDVISGGATANGCAPECLVVPGACGGQSVYVSAQCPPYPSFPGPGFVMEGEGDVQGAGDPCAAAFAAFADGGTCPGTPGDDASADAAEGGPGGCD